MRLRGFALRTWLVGITAVAFLWTTIACFLPTAQAMAMMVLPFFVYAIVGNALRHVYRQFAFTGYAPGFASCALLNVPSILLVSWHALRDRLAGFRELPGRRDWHFFRGSLLGLLEREVQFVADRSCLRLPGLRAWHRVASR